LLLLVGGAAVYPACGKREASSTSDDGAAGEGEGGALDAATDSASGDDGGVTTDGAEPGDVSSDSDASSADGSSESSSDAARDAGPDGDEGGDSSADAARGVDGESDGSPDAGTTDGDAGSVTGCPPTGANVLVLLFSAYPQLRQVGAAVQLTPSGYSDPVCGQNSIVVVQTAPGQFVALSSSCTHACCIVSYVANQLRCACHGAAFNMQGQVVTGTQLTTTPLQVLATCWDANGVYVTL
jgi:Rieske Fe-S protein